MNTIIAEDEPPVGAGKVENGNELSRLRVNHPLAENSAPPKAQCCDRWGHTCEGCHASITASEGER